MLLKVIVNACVHDVGAVVVVRLPIDIFLVPSEGQCGMPPYPNGTSYCRSCLEMRNRQQRALLATLRHNDGACHLQKRNAQLDLQLSNHSQTPRVVHKRCVEYA